MKINTRIRRAWLGLWTLRRRGHGAELPVSRAYVHHFKAMQGPDGP